MKKLYLLFTLVLFHGSFLFSQVAINADGSAPHESAGLDISYPDKGLLIPRLSLEQRNAIASPAEGLIVFCSNCGSVGNGVLSIFQGGSWKVVELTCIKPNPPTQLPNVSSLNQIVWNWIACPLAIGYKWNTTDDYSTAIDLGPATTYTETDLACWTNYTRYIWSYNVCGNSLPLAMNQVTLDTPINTPPAEGTHSSTVSSILWSWYPVAGASGYKWSVNNDFNTAINVGAGTVFTENGLTCGTSYTRYIWAYNDCGKSVSTTIGMTTSSIPPAAPDEAIHQQGSTQIIWNWSPVTDAAGYKWNTINEYSSAMDVGTNTSMTETGLDCNSPQTSFVWTYNSCGISVAKTLTGSTITDIHPSPVAADHDPSSFQVVWKWHPLPNHPSNYKWYTSNDYGSAFDMLSDTSYTETGLLCNTSYNRYVWAYDGCGVSEPIIISSNTALFPPANPGQGTHVASATQIEWTWTEVPDATGYLWGVTNNPGTAQDMGLNTSFPESGLECNTDYTRFVWAYSNCGTSVATTLEQTSALDPPPAPEASAHEAYANLIIWNWQPVPGASGYKWSTVDNFENAMEMGSGTSKIESGLTCNHEYIRYVWAYDDCGVSDAGTLVQATALDPPQDPGIGSHVPSPFQIVWHWFAVSDATGYKWNDENDYSSAEEMGTLLEKTETGLGCNTNYTRYVWAYSLCGHSAAVSMVQTTSLNPPVPPTAATHAPSPTQIIWNWNPVSGASGYKWNNSNNVSTATDVGLLTTFTQTGLSCNTPYICYVWSYSNCGTSTPVSFNQTTSLNPPVAPTAGSHTASPAQIIWRWNVVSGATGYKWSTTNNYATATDMGTSLSRTETGLNCNTAYQRYVWAYSNCGNSTAATLSQTTTIETPAAPAAGTHVASNTQVIWNWNAVAGVTGYKWNTVNDYATAINMATATTYTENNLVCGTNYTRYVWAYNNCANSVSVQLIKTTAVNPPPNPVAATHTVSGNQIIWNWNIVTGATGYKWSATNDYATATDVGNVTSKTENGLACSTGYTRYVWAYNGCANSSSVSLSATTTATPPASPVPGDHTAYSSQIVWTWNPVGDAAGYKWNTVNIYSSAVDVGASTSHAESGLSCSTTYTRFAWAYNSCGVSTPVILTQTTINDPPASPTVGTHVITPDQITWNWNVVGGAAGYKWSTTNDYGTAQEMGSSTSMVETGLNCATSYTRYVWAYHSCGTSTALTMTQSTEACFVCGTTINKSHVAGTVAPVNKTTSYGTVTNVPGATTKCWITSNLGSDHQATAANDATEASAGWYWQFNHMQGFKHDGTTRTPNTTWITYIEEAGGWNSSNDPCTIELGTGWRLPTSTEYSAVDAAGSWNGMSGPWNSLLKMHSAGFINATTATMDSRGSKGDYWSSTQSSYNHMGMVLYFSSTSSSVTMYPKANGYSIRCLRD